MGRDQVFNKHTNSLCKNGYLLFFFALFGMLSCSESPSSSTVHNIIQPNQQIDNNRVRSSNIVSRATSAEAFAQTLYPLLTANCASCHSTVGAIPPLIADPDPALALEEIATNNSVDLIQPENSLMVVKLNAEQHNCWSGVDACAADANTLQVAIGEWGAMVNTGQGSYAQLCSSCHGVDGQGTADNIGVTRPIALAELTTLIDTKMPLTDPTLCVGSCATEIAQYIFNNFSVANNDLLDEPLAGLPEGQPQIDILCARLQSAGAQNVVRDTFCDATAPQINGLRDLQAALGLAFVNPNATGRRNNGRRGNPAFALVGHSSSLVARLTSAINPRALIFTPPNGRNPTPGLIAMGYVRGDQFAELVTSDRVTNALQFFLVTFKQQCNLTHSCTPGDLLTPAVESNWIEYTVYGQVDLENTILDCLQCHQTEGPGTANILRMQELNNPWSHFFRNDREGGIALLSDFVAAHGTNEDYAGIPAQLIDASDPALLEDLVRGNGFRNQPNRFNSRRIQNQVNQTQGQPQNNDTPGSSAEWQRIYNNTVLGQFIAVPYHDIKITDSAKLAAMTQSYQAFLNGVLAATDLPDIREVFLDAGLRDMGFKVMAGLDGQQIITQACIQCHNSRLNQTITRARFNVDIARMSDTQGGVLTGSALDAELSLAIARLKLPPEDVRKMPPELFKTLDPAEIEAAASYLCSLMSAPSSQCANVTAFVSAPAPLPAAGPAPGAGGGGGGGDDDD